MMMEEVGSEKGKQVPSPAPEAPPVTTAAALPPRPSGFVPYPKPLAEYEDVARDPELFIKTLEKLHATMGTKFMIPIIGGKELNLHRVFVEVTSRGGIQKVIGDKKWREVIATFNFPSTATNASFVLRKYYMSLLHHYEQIYFHKLQGWSPAVTAVSHTPRSPTSSVPVGTRRLFEQSPGAESQIAPQKQSRVGGEFAPSGMSLHVNSIVSGVIDGKCEHGYFVTVTVGTIKLKGVLYHIPEPAAAQAPRLSCLAADDGTVKVDRRRRRRKKLSSRDPTHPKPNRRGYNFFFAEQHARLKPLHPGKDREISRMIGDLWNNLTETEKAVYQDKGAKDKERYRSEMEVYRQRSHVGGVVINEAVPIQQCPANPDFVMGAAFNNNTFSGMDMDGGEVHNRHIDSFSGSSSADSEMQDSDTDSGMEASPDAGGGTGTESTSVAAELSNEGDAFELRRRDDTGVSGPSKVEQDHSVSSADTEVKNDESIEKCSSLD